MRPISVKFRILFVVLILGICAFVFQARSKSISLVSTLPKNGAQSYSPDGKVEFTFSDVLDETTPYDSFSITPRVEGRVDVSATSIAFIPSVALDQSTNYSVSIKNIRAVSGEVVSVKDFSFRTGERVLSKFEKSLPYDAGDYTIDLLENGLISVYIANPPFEENKKAALDYLSDKGIASSRIKVQVRSTNPE